MGMSWSSYVLARMLRATLGDRTWVTHYADDLVIWADTRLGCYRRLQEINELLTAHSWLPHKLKEVEPSQRPEILGVHFDLKQKTCRIGRSYRQKLLLELASAATLTMCTKRQMAQFIGGVSWAAMALPTLRPPARPLMATMCSAKKWHHFIDLTNPSLTIQETLLTIMRMVSDNKPCSFAALPTQRTTIASDASSRFLATHCDGRVFTRVFTQEEMKLHIGDKEALALRTSITQARRTCSHALFLVDSKALFHAVNKGASFNATFNATCDMFAAARVHDQLQLKVQWIPSAQNKADLPTRPELLPTGVTHPECLSDGIDAYIPALWSSPRLSTALRSGRLCISEGPTIAGMPCLSAIWV